MWTESHWSNLLSRGTDRLPHALLLAGAPGLGKRHFAEALAALLLCEASGIQMHACGCCDACRWLASGNHPDFRRLEPGGDEDVTEEGDTSAKKKTSTNISIDAVRALEDFVFVGSHRHGKRVIVITEAEAMQGPAANSLLKILEEPPSSVYFILISSRPRILLPTLRSRCRILSFNAPSGAQAREWISSITLPKDSARYLELAGGAPLRVAQWNEQKLLPCMEVLIASLTQTDSDPLALAAKWDALLKKEVQFTREALVEGVQRWLFDLAQEVATGQADSVRYHAGWPRPKPGHTFALSALVQAWRDLLRFRRSARHPLNQTLFLEDLAAHTLRAFRQN